MRLTVALLLATPLLRAQPAASSPARTPAGAPGQTVTGSTAAPSRPDAVPLPPASGEELVGPVKFGEVTIDAALEMLERWSGRSVLRPNALPATTLTFTLNQKVTKEEARQALETLLTLNGIAVTPLGEKFLKVTPLNTVRGEAPEYLEGSTLGLPPSGRVASKLFQLKFLRVAELVPQLSNILQPGMGAPPVLFDKANAALVTDTVSNLQRIEALIARVDQPALAGLTPKFYKLAHSTPTDVVNKLRALLTGAVGEQIGSSTSYQADDRTNQIILISDPRQHPFFDELIAKLDAESETNSRQEVLQLKHANAPDVATVLSQLISGQNSARSASGATYRPGATTMPAATPPANQPRPSTPAPVTAAVASALANAAGSQQQQFSNLLTVVADERSNSLVVSGTVDDIHLIKDLVEKIDVLLAQVRIEVVIAEVTLTDNSSTGIDALGLVVQGNRLVAFSASGPGGRIGGTSDSNPFMQILNQNRNISLSGLISLGTTPRKNDTNFLSVPSLVTTHNKEANIFVGESRPVITSYQNTTATTNVATGYTSNVTYKDIGISLTVKPLIGNDGSVQLDIKQEVNDILGTITIDGNEQPRIGSRKTESFVTVGSGEIVVLGGLQRKTFTRETNRLGGIPLLGDLLGRRSRENTRTDLVFFLRPYVLTNTAADNRETMDRMKSSPQRDDVNAALKGEFKVRN
jgi:general secretion pathway protein D